MHSERALNHGASAWACLLLAGLSHSMLLETKQMKAALLHFPLSYILEAHLSLDHGVPRAVNLRQDGNLALSLLVTSFLPALDLVFVAPVAEQLVSVADLMELCASSLRVQR